MAWLFERLIAFVFCCMLHLARIHGILSSSPRSDEVAPVYAETVKSLIPAMMAEFIGSALFIFIACGAGENEVSICDRIMK
jgi:hypothetical protein